MRPADCKPGFDYLEHEARFQAAAVWWLETLLVSSREPVRRGQPRATRIAAALLAASSFLFLLDEGRLSKTCGELARMNAVGEAPSAEWTAKLVRGTSHWAPLIQWSPYYIARALLVAVGAIVLWMLYDVPPWGFRRRHDPYRLGYRHAADRL